MPYSFNIDAYNAICQAYGGTGGHVYNIDALNEWAGLVGGTGGHSFNIDALNEIATALGGSGGHALNIDALNEISGLLSGTGGHVFTIDALTEIVGLPAGVGPFIALSASTIAEDAAVGDDVGTLSVSNPSGSYTFALTDDAGGLFALNADGVTLEVAGALDYETAQSHDITVTASNGVDADLSRTFTVFVTDVVEATLTAPTLTWTSAQTVDPPEFNIDLTNPQEGDIVRLYKDGVLAGSHTLTAGELSSLTFDLGLTAWGNGTYSATATHVRGAVESAASNTEPVTIAASWTPANLAVAPAVWVEAADGITGGTAWADKSGNGRDFAISGATYNATAFGGAPAIVTDGVNDYAEVAWTYSGAPLSIFLAMGTASTSGGNRLMSITSGATADYDSDAEEAFALFDATQWQVYRPSEEANTIFTAGSAEHTLSVLHDGAQRVVRLDGTVKSTVTDAGVFGFDRIRIGGSADGVTFTQDDIFCFIALGYTATQTEYEQIEGYIAWQASDAGNTALVDALPVGHPYKAARP